MASDSKKTSTSIVELLADFLRFPDLLLKQREDKSRNPSRSRARLIESGAIQDNYPNFENIGFKSQAFVDIELSIGADTNQVRSNLHGVVGVVMIYSVFGQVDMRCKVVGIDLRQVEKVAMEIRKIIGISRVYTNVVLDEGDKEALRENWARLVENSADKLRL